jgi:hypothetical protein
VTFQYIDLGNPVIHQHRIGDRSRYVAANAVRDAEGDGLFHDTISAFAWKDLEKLNKILNYTA